VKLGYAIILKRSAALMACLMSMGWPWAATGKILGSLPLGSDPRMATVLLRA
jgi:hypothetical protein